jgi:Chaperone of endosialidase
MSQLGTMSSSRRYKKEIKPMNKASEAILALKPVTFHYKSDSTNKPEFGLIAEEVAEVNPDLVVRDENGEIYTVRYDAVNAMLLNEFLKAHKRMQDLEARDAQQQKQIEALMKQLREQAAQIQKVSPQHELGESAPEVASNNP